MQKRILGFAALVGAVLILVGFFAPWISRSGGGISITASAWDFAIPRLIMGIDTERETWAILALMGTVMTLMCCLTVLASPKTKLLWVTVAVGGILALVGALWALTDIDTFDVEGLSVRYGSGLYLTLMGGILCFVSSFLGLLFGLYKKSLLGQY